MIEQSSSQPLRFGPRPLGLHLGLAATTFSSSLAALPLARNGQLPWSTDLKEDAEQLKAQLEEHELPLLLTELATKGHDLIREMLAGIKKYHAHPYHRKNMNPPVIWSKGSASLLDYGADLQRSAPIAFVVPSLVNKGYILDLMPERSFMNALVRAGIRPLLVDWGVPAAGEKEYNLENYILEILVPAMDHVRHENPETSIHLVGYCMGGTLAVAQAFFQQHHLKSMIALASPWNFHEGLTKITRQFLSQEAAWDAVLAKFGEMPVDMLQAFFASLDPGLCLRKFVLFNRMSMESQKAKEFVALEDWLNDGVPLVKNVALECFTDWYGMNKPYQGEWKVEGEKIRPQNITIPVMIAIPKSDRIVPSGSAYGLAEQLPNGTVITPPSGHIGMVAGGQAEHGLWADVIKWIAE